MRLKIFIGIALLATAFTACKPEGRVYEKHRSLSPNVEWLRKDVQKFEVPVDDNDIPYNLSLSFRYASGYQYEVAKVKVTETSPGGNETVREYDLKVRDGNGDYIGDPGYDIWDSEHLVEAGKRYDEKGTYTYVIEHMMPADPLHFAMEVGVILDKAG